MIGISSEENKKTVKVILLCVLVYALLNHGIRYFARDQGKATITTLAHWSVGMPTAHAVMGADDFRFATGEQLTKASQYCPKSLLSNCLDISHLIRIILGLH